MKLLHTRFFKVVTIFSLVMLLFTPVVTNAQTNSSEDEKDVEELADALEFVYEEAVIKDEEGNIVGIDTKKIEEKFGSESTSELGKIKENANCDRVSVQSNSYVDCVSDKLGDYLGALVPTTAVATILKELDNGNYTLAAKKLVKAGVKGSIYGIAANLAWIETTCLWQEKDYR